MSEAENLATGGSAGLPVGDAEDLYRCIIPLWWVVEEDRVSSAAFKFPIFSVDVASIAGSPQATLSRFSGESGIAAFACGEARMSGGDVRLELDPDYPENKAHAHVHMPQSSGKRKTAARKLVEACRVLIKPNISS
jgi:hypothetical protein